MFPDYEEEMQAICTMYVGTYVLSTKDAGGVSRHSQLSYSMFCASHCLRYFYLVYRYIRLGPKDMKHWAG